MGSQCSRLTQADHVIAWEALLLELIRKVKGEKNEYLKKYGSRKGLSESYNDLKEILHILRGNKRLNEKGRLALYYYVCDLVELVQDLITSYKEMGPDMHIRRCMGALKTRMLLSESNIGSEELVREADITDDEDVVGLGSLTEAILGKAIFSEEPALFKLVIEGMAGVGKTTLVRKIYSHARAVDEFERRAWVRVPSNFSHKGVLMNLIQQVVDDDDDDQRSVLVEKMIHADVATLQQMLHKYLLGKQYFIVIDGVPEEMYLSMIYKGLPNEDKGSRLLLTSRFQNTLARASQYKMEPLNSDNSWELFKKTIFGGNKFTSNHEFPKHLERKAKEMLTKCGGVPSAIKNVAMQVGRMRESGSEWEEQLLESIDLDTTLDVFEESYQRLDPDAKTCFMFLACFKENTTIKKGKFVHILEVGGAVHSKHIAQLCLIALVKQYFLDEHGTVIMNVVYRSVRINAMLHRLSIKKAVEGIGFEILSNNGNTQRSQSPRHRVIKCSRDKFDYSTDKDKHLVSLFFHGGSGCLDSINPSYWKSFKKLKILHLENFGLKILPEGIGLLSELRYLGLRKNYIQALPRSLRKLEKLEVLDIAQNFLVEVPNIIWDMDSLLRLNMSDVICLEPLGKYALRHLETLTYISIDDWTCLLSGLENQNIGLRTLGIEGLDESTNISKLFASLAELRSLYSLILKGFRFKSMPCLDELGILESIHAIKLDGFLARLPRSFPPKMHSLSLVNTCLDQDPMPVLGKLSSLATLKLENAYTGEEMEILDAVFPELQVLHINQFRNLRSLRFGKGAMASLMQLEINNCPYLETLPEELGSMAELQELRMVTTKNIANKIRNTGYLSKIPYVAFHA